MGIIAGEAMKEVTASRDRLGYDDDERRRRRGRGVVAAAWCFRVLHDIIGNPHLLFDFQFIFIGISYTPYYTYSYSIFHPPSPRWWRVAAGGRSRSEPCNSNNVGHMELMREGMVASVASWCRGDMSPKMTRAVLCRSSEHEYHS